MKRNIWTLIAALFLLTSLDASAQRWRLQRYQAELYVSGVSFHGDVGVPNSPLANHINGFRPSVGFQPRYYITRDLALSLDLAYVLFAGQDPEESSHVRVWTLNSHAFQHFAKLEYYFLNGLRNIGGSGIYNRRGMVNRYNMLDLYIFGGGGGILCKPKIVDTNTKLEIIGEEGYDNSLQYAAGFPAGAGIRFALDPRWSVGLELGYMFTFTDYLDGYGSRFSHHNDSYYLTSIKIVYRIATSYRGLPMFRKYYR